MDVPPARVAAAGERLTELNDLSFVIPVLNEESIIASLLGSLQTYRLRGAEIVLVDGGSSDKTIAMAQPWVDKLVTSKAGRARQMNSGAKVVTRKYLCFLHADTQLPDNAGERLLAFMASDCCWGRFDIRLSGSRWMFVVISTLINWRSRLSGIATGDQAIFMTYQAFAAVDGFPTIPLMEDVAISRKLKLLGQPYFIDSPVTTSSRRWEKNGICKTILLMWKLRWQYYRGVSPEKLYDQYYGSR
jgi:rSAM/selenodomain-associated transferase 2